MSKNHLKTIDSIYIVFIIIALLLTLLGVVTLRGVLSSWSTSREIDDELIQLDSQLNIIKLEEAYNDVAKTK